MPTGMNSRNRMVRFFHLCVVLQVAEGAHQIAARTLLEDARIGAAVKLRVARHAETLVGEADVDGGAEHAAMVAAATGRRRR